ncbi:hypothetical protein Tco_0369280 [Tanacetum coccineum]
MVLLGREPEPEVEAVLLFTNLVIRRKTGRSNLVCNHLRSVTGIPLVVVNWTVVTPILDIVPRAGVGVGIFLIENQCSNHISQLCNIDESFAGVGRARTHFGKQWPLLVIDELWNIALDDFRHSRAFIQKVVPPAASAMNR